MCIMELNDLYKAILKGDLNQAKAVTNDAIMRQIDPQNIINNYMITAMEDIGTQFESGKVFVPNLLLSARAMKGSLELLKPLMREENNTYIGRIVIGTVKGDLHDIGKNLVASMFEGCGFEVINLGVDVSSEQFIAAATEHKADIICMSALLTTTMNYMKEVIAAIETSGLKGKIKVMIGGAPVNDDFAKVIGADAYTSNANAAVAMAKKLILTINKSRKK